MKVWIRIDMNHKQTTTKTMMIRMMMIMIVMIMKMVMIIRLKMTIIAERNCDTCFSFRLRMILTLIIQKYKDGIIIAIVVYRSIATC